MGMNFLGVKEYTGDARFDYRCMGDDKKFLGDQGAWDPIFNKAATDPLNGSVRNDAGALHGVITIAGISAELCDQSYQEIKKLFGSSITISGGKPVEGRARPGDFKGHEHFGFQDGISQPAPRGVVAPHKGQTTVDPGVIVMGYPGDPVRDDPTIKVKRPAWTKDGTMLVFRKLEQDVLLWDWFADKNGKRWREFIPPGYTGPDLNTQQGKDLFEARLVGRWKSGAPLARCPYKDNPAMAKNEDENNDFDYSIPGTNEPSNLYCPFTIHTRKTSPRNLDPYVSRKYLESGSIVRGGLPYGPEVTDQERRDFNPDNLKPSPRGLLFNCYASNLDQGFIRQTISYAGNDYFPLTSLVPTKHGQDPILGSNPPTGSAGQQRPAKLEQTYAYTTGEQVNFLLTDDKNNQYEVSGFIKVNTPGAQPPPGADNPFFVTSRGGEYFFVPSISTLTTWANSPDIGGATSGLDILFLLDATSSMQTYIDQVRDNVQKMCDSLAGSGKWPAGSPRFGFVTFRDHPPQEPNFLTRVYPFDSDVDAIKSNLSRVVAAGGGDGPEAQCDALAEAIGSKVSWKKDATRIVVLITDSPPHGINEDEDEIPKGCPNGNDPVVIANKMASLGITLHVLSCEPTLSTEYSMPLDFYRGITLKTGGKLFALSDVNTLTELILGSTLETHDIEGLVAEHAADIQSQAGKGGNTDSISQNLHQRLLASGTKINTLDVEDIYEPSKDGDKNAEVWFQAKAVDDYTKGKLKEVFGFRLKPGYRQGGKQAIKLQQQPVNLQQVKRVVTKCLAKAA
ncbi:hypothetical protein FRC07_014957 [Ceratobasidium sp. 392]|nr:hypothetical protein FRC07_014957 [Ceratobasidium sp. 392]